jgi:peptidoglycan/LPS O-acetylase OafA/YrhL
MAAIAYRPEIDGLRAIAVLSVLVFHLNPGWLPGGFVGVDIFFVISGFLISSIIYAECRTNTFSFAKFYQRRVARLFPAFFTVALITVFVAAKLQLSQDLASAGQNLVAATLSLANIRYMLRGNYFEISPDAQPYLHYWSLSVEEQFYMVFPALIFVLFRRWPRSINPLLAFLAAASFALCVGLSFVKPSWAFYLLPTRGWELLAGCLLGVTIGISEQRAGRWHGLIAALGLAAIGLSFFVISEESRFPGYIALLPVLGTAAIIRFAGSSDWTGAFLSTAAMVFIGKISYSLYLWHWPVYSFVDYSLYLYSTPTRLALKVGLTLVCTLACYYLIEKRARAFLNRPSRQRFAFMSLAAMVIASVSIGFYFERENYLNADAGDIASGGIAFGNPDSANSLVLMGDSHASGYGVICRDIARELDLRLNIISIAAGDPLPACPDSSQSAKTWNDSLQQVKELRPEVTVLVMRWETKLSVCKDRLKVAIEELSKYTDRIILVTQPPVMPREASRAEVRKGARPPFIEPEKHRKQRVAMNEFVKSFASERVEIVDIEHLFGTSDGQVFYWDDEGRLLYQDEDHLSGYGNQYVSPLFKEALRRQILELEHE